MIINNALTHKSEPCNLEDLDSRNCSTAQALMTITSSQLLEYKLSNVPADNSNTTWESILSRNDNYTIYTVSHAWDYPKIVKESKAYINVKC